MDKELIDAKKESYRLFGTTNLEQAFRQIEAERADMLILHDKNTAQRIVIQRMDALMKLCMQIAVLANEEAALFSPKLRRILEQFNISAAEKEKYMREALKL